MPLKLYCPVETDGEPCEQEIEVSISPIYKGGQWDPPEGPTIEDVVCRKCGHQADLESGRYDDKLFLQLEDV